jgi:hypothetical protein
MDSIRRKEIWKALLTHIPQSSIEQVAILHFRAEEVENLVMNGLQVQNQPPDTDGWCQPQHIDPFKQLEDPLHCGRVCGVLQRLGQGLAAPAWFAPNVLPGHTSKAPPPLSSTRPSVTRGVSKTGCPQRAAGLSGSETLAPPSRPAPCRHSTSSRRATARRSFRCWPV